MTSIFNIFAKSPIQPLQEHMAKSYECALILPAFFKKVIAEDWEAVEAEHRLIVECENEADELKQKLRLNLPQSLFLPVSRADLIQMIRIQDKVANRAKDIAGLILGRKMQLPKSLAKAYLEFLDASLRTVKKANKAISELNDLLEAGFRGVEIKVVEKMIIELDESEHDSDLHQVKLRRQLYDVESELSPIDAMFWYKVIEWTGDLADSAQSIGGQLQLLLAR